MTPRPPHPGDTMTTTETEDWPCCEHCDHDPGMSHAGACITCHFDLPDYDRS